MDKIIIIIALFLFSSCSSQKENREHDSIYSYSDLKEYSTNITRSEDFLSLPLEYVELETTDNSLVGYVERIVVNTASSISNQTGRFICSKETVSSGTVSDE